MKLHYYLTNTAIKRKLKSVIEGVLANVKEVGYKQNANVPTKFGILPVLQTPQEIIFSSNPIIKYLADSNQNTLYGQGCANKRSLIDQWLDITTSQFQPVVRAFIYNQSIDFVRVNKYLHFVENRLSDKKFLVGDSLSIADLSLASNISVPFQSKNGGALRERHPNILKWYKQVVQTNLQVGPPFLQDQQRDDNIVVLKTTVVFDAKVFSQQVNLKQLYTKIKSINLNSLTWGQKPAFTRTTVRIDCTFQSQLIGIQQVYKQVKILPGVQQITQVSSFNS